MRTQTSPVKRTAAWSVFALFLTGVLLGYVPLITQAAERLPTEGYAAAFGLILLLLCLVSAAAQGMLLIPPLLVTSGFLSGRYAALTAEQAAMAGAWPWLSALLLSAFVLTLFCLASCGLAASRMIWLFLRTKYRRAFIGTVFMPAALAALVIFIYFLQVSAR